MLKAKLSIVAVLALKEQRLYKCFLFTQYLIYLKH